MRAPVFLISLLISIEVFAKEIVKVGVYDFPPYVFIGDLETGISSNVIKKMNGFQQDYQFVLVPTTPRRRYKDFNNNRFDMLIFESKDWGWQDYPVESSRVFVKGAEVYVSQAKIGRGQNFFSDFENKVMIGVLGYHYGFANFSGDQNYLHRTFDLIQTSGQAKSLELILKGRGEIAVLTKEYLNHHFLRHPRDKNRLLISDKFDQVYRHTILIRKNHKLSIQYINNLLEKMKQRRTLNNLWQTYGLEVIY